MNKQEFRDELQKRLNDFSEEDKSKVIEYYTEMIDDRCEDGSTEDEAVAALGSVEDIEAEVREGSGKKVIRKERRRLKTWELVLIIAGFPVWLPLGLAVLVIAAALYIVLWTLCICVYAVTLSCAAAGLFGIAAAVVGLANGYGAHALVYLGASAFALGMFFLGMLASKYVTKGMVRLTVLTFRGIKSIFTGKENK